MARLTVDGILEEKEIPKHSYDTLCACGHRHAEHSAFSACHGCSECLTTDDVGADRDHAYERCACRDFAIEYAEYPEDAASA